jgi:flagellin-like protein
MKGVSTVIATLLMLVITISLAGLTYAYMSGLFSTQTSVILQVDAGASTCNPTASQIIVYVNNVGTGSGLVSALSGTTAGGAIGNNICTPTAGQTIAAGGSASFTCGGKTGTAGYYQVRANSSSVVATGTVYCTA